MAIEAMEFHNDGIAHLTNGGARWNNAADDFTWVLLGSGYTQAPTDTTYGDISAQEIGDADYAQKAVTTRTINNTAGQVQFKADPADFGDAVSIEAKFLALVQGTAGSLGAGAKVIGTFDLDNSSGTATRQSTNGDFDISQAATGWFVINF